MRFRTFAYSSRIELRLYLADCSLEFLQSSTLGSDIRLRRLKRFRLFCERGAAIRVPRFFVPREDAARAVNIRRLIFLFLSSSLSLMSVQGRIVSMISDVVLSTELPKTE